MLIHSAGLSQTAITIIHSAGEKLKIFIDAVDFCKAYWDVFPVLCLFRHIYTHTLYVIKNIHVLSKASFHEDMKYKKCVLFFFKSVTELLLT